MLHTIQNHAQALLPELISLSKNLYDQPELGHQEHYACEQHTALLRKYGFTLEQPYIGMATAFKATYASGKPGPTIAFLAEYDALPGIGHGCGHNILGATSTGSAIVLRQLIDELGGTVVVLGTPAEETDGGKAAIADSGDLKNIDIALMAHPSNTYCRSGSSLALMPLRFEFFGQTSHAAASPEMGINALHAVISLFNNISALREHLRSDCRIHGVIKDGGKAANIVPEYTMAEFFVRATTKTYLNELVQKVTNCANAAALSNGATLKISQFEASYDNMITNQLLSDLFTAKLLEVGVPHVEDARPSTGSSDAGNVSQCCPMIHSYFDITNNPSVASHTREFASASITDYANEQMRKTILAFVLTAVELIERPELVAEAKAEFARTEK